MDRESKTVAGTGVRKSGRSMTMKPRLRILTWLIAVNALFLPCSCLPVAFLIPWNPMLELFITDFAVSNSSDTPIKITPVGAVGKKGDRWPLTIYESKKSTRPLAQRGGFEIPPGEAVTFFYDWDDIQFSEIVVASPGQPLAALIVSPDPTVNQYSAPASNRFDISNIDELAPVDEGVRVAYEVAQNPREIAWWTWLLLMPVASFALLLALNCRARVSSSPSHESSALS